MMQRFIRNNVYDAYGNVVIAQLPSDLPYMILECPELPQYKGDKKTVSGSFTDPLYSETNVIPIEDPSSEEEPKTTECTVLLPILKKGDTGDAVKNVQTLLIAKGYYCGGGRTLLGREKPDGDFGPATEKSVRDYQRLTHLQDDGIIGEDTWKVLLVS